MTFSVRSFVLPESTHPHIIAIIWSKLSTCDLVSKGLITLCRSCPSSMSPSSSTLLVFCFALGILRVKGCLVLSSLSSEWCFRHQTMPYVASAPYGCTLIGTTCQSIPNQITGFWILLFVMCAKRWSLGDDQRICTDCSIVQLSIISRVTSSMCRCPNNQSESSFQSVGLSIIYLCDVQHVQHPG